MFLVPNFPDYPPYNKGSHNETSSNESGGCANAYESPDPENTRKYKQATFFERHHFFGFFPYIYLIVLNSLNKIVSRLAANEKQEVRAAFLLPADKPFLLGKIEAIGYLLPAHLDKFIQIGLQYSRFYPDDGKKLRQAAR
jgi:hypothetical protein